MFFTSVRTHESQDIGKLVGLLSQDSEVGSGN
jgi:hypothetical protein